MIEPVRPPLRALSDDRPGDRPQTLDLRLRLVDPEVIADLVDAGEGSARETLAIQALKIGLLALRQARGRIDADAVRREGEQILKSLKDRLETHQGDVEKQIRGALREYFDPDSGRFSERVQRLVKKDGELEQSLRRLVGEKDSELARTLASSVGEQSPLLKTLDPTQTGGIVRTLGKTVEDALTSQRERILSAFSLDQADSALSRLVRELKNKHGELETGFAKNVAAIRADFSLDVKDSPLSRLVGRVEEAQATIRREFTLDQKDSALARMRGEILDVIERQGKAAADFQSEVRATLSSIAARRAESAKSTRHGLTFEDDVWTFVERRALRAADVAERCGATPGLVARCKTGDCVVTLGASRAAAGSKMVVEAKKMAGWSLAKAVAEIEEARRNRGAQAGVFVFAGGCAPEGFPRFLPQGNDVFVVWDAEDPASDVYLDAALCVAEALCTRMAAQSEERTQDLESLDYSVNEIQKQATGLDEIETSARTVSSGADRIIRRVEIMRKVFAREIEDLRDGLRDLRAE